MQDVVYYIDRIRINTFYNVDKLKKMLPEFKDKIHFPFKIAQQYGYRSKIKLTPATIPDLEKINDVLGSDNYYSITYIEIAKDTICNTEREALRKVIRMHTSLRLKWSTSHKHLDYSELGYEDEMKRLDINEIKKTYSSYLTGDYYGYKCFKFTVYPRESKILNKPAVHEEFRISNATEIKKRTGILNLLDLSNLDLKNCFESWENKFIDKKIINHEVLGYWLFGGKGRIKGRGKFTREKMADCHGRHYCDVHEITNYNALVSHFSLLKKKIKVKRGRRTEFEKKILNCILTTGFQ